MIRIVELGTFDETKLYIGQEEVTKKKDNTEYRKISIKYDEGTLLFPIKTKTMGVKTFVTPNGYERKTMPFVFEERKSEHQNSFISSFGHFKSSVYRQLLGRGYDTERLEKLGSCFWAERIMYAGIVSSIWDSSHNSRFFLSGEEVSVDKISDCTDYDANGVISVDSIYVGENSICIQAKLYEVHLTPAKKRARVLWD